MVAYYNEIDPFAAAWLRELIKACYIAYGIVDERSIVDVAPVDVMGFTQCHFFAGIGVWSYALRKAGWPDDRPIWTGSAPCQPFSAAGASAGFADERHLWPHFYHLISQCRPPVIAGEQVASKDADAWIDLVQDDMEAMDYAFGAVPFPSASVGAPHIRDRDYWLAYAIGGGSTRFGGSREERTTKHSNVSGLAYADGGHSSAEGLQRSGQQRQQPQDGRSGERGRDLGAPGPTNGFWRNADWLFCRDGKWRPVESGTFPMAHRAAARVGRLRGYGNAINAEQAQAFIEAFMSLV